MPCFYAWQQILFSTFYTFYSQLSSCKNIFLIVLTRPKGTLPLFHKFSIIFSLYWSDQIMFSRILLFYLVSKVWLVARWWIYFLSLCNLITHRLQTGEMFLLLGEEIMEKQFFVSSCLNMSVFFSTSTQSVLTTTVPGWGTVWEGGTTVSSTCSSSRSPSSQSSSSPLSSHTSFYVSTSLACCRYALLLAAFLVCSKPAGCKWAVWNAAEFWLGTIFPAGSRQRTTRLAIFMFK